MNNIVFRHATNKDINDIIDIYNDIIENEKTTGWEKGVYPLPSTATEALLRNDLFVCVSEGAVVGSAIINNHQMDIYNSINWKYKVEPHKVMVLHTLAISPKHKHQGLGLAFVSFFEQKAKLNKCTVVRLDTQSKNTPALMLYKKTGYLKTQTINCVFNGMENIELVVLEKLIM